ncbi:hypothetical protein [Tenacibaculum sp. UWU-22]|uniref:hypothetical protein n=1 Tax=Tenacibaculum sp. UWU-22 TaxID=3234187 RepID=UPI0034DB1345
MNTNIKHSESYINSKTGKKTGFKVHSTYFDEFEDTFFTNLSTDTLPEKSGFTVSKTYFDTLESAVLSTLSLKEPKAKIVSIRKMLLHFIPVAAAASVLLFIGINYFSSSSTKTTIDNITPKEIELWYDSNYGSIDETEFASAIDSFNFDESEFLTSNQNEIENYLENIDPATLINEIQLQND